TPQIPGYRGVWHPACCEERTNLAIRGRHASAIAQLFEEGQRAAVPLQGLVICPPQIGDVAQLAAGGCCLSRPLWHPRQRLAEELLLTTPGTPGLKLEADIPSSLKRLVDLSCLVVVITRFQEFFDVLSAGLWHRRYPPAPVARSAVMGLT